LGLRVIIGDFFQGPLYTYLGLDLVRPCFQSPPFFFPGFVENYGGSGLSSLPDDAKLPLQASPRPKKGPSTQKVSSIKPLASVLFSSTGYSYTPLFLSLIFSPVLPFQPVALLFFEESFLSPSPLLFPFPFTLCFRFCLGPPPLTFIVKSVESLFLLLFFFLSNTNPPLIAWPLNFYRSPSPAPVRVCVPPQSYRNPNSTVYVFPLVSPSGLSPFNASHLLIHSFYASSF